MPWNSGSVTPLPGGETGEYAFAFFTSPPGTNQVGVSIEVTDASLEGRLRVGFYYPFVLANGRVIYGTGGEMAGVTVGASTAIHNASFAFVQSSFLASATDELFGVTVAAARGISAGSIRLWRFT